MSGEYEKPSFELMWDFSEQDIQKEKIYCEIDSFQINKTEDLENKYEVTFVGGQIKILDGVCVDSVMQNLSQEEVSKIKSIQYFTAKKRNILEKSELHLEN